MNADLKGALKNINRSYRVFEHNGNKFMFVMNMPPVKMKGVLSEAMIVAEDTFTFNEILNEWEAHVKLIKVS